MSSDQTQDSSVLLHLDLFWTDFFCTKNVMWTWGHKRYNHMISEGSSPDSCVRCGACEEKCPQHISIRNQLADVAEQLG